MGFFYYYYYFIVIIYIILLSFWFGKYGCSRESRFSIELSHLQHKQVLPELT